MTSTAEENNDAAKALKKKNTFENWDGKTRVNEGAGYNPYDNPNAGKKQVIDGVEYEVPANATIQVPNPDNPEEVIEVENTSRGRLGVPTDPQKIAELKQAGQWENVSGETEPLTPEQMQARIQKDREDQKRKIAIREQEQIKMRVEMQGQEYTPPKGFEDVPSLAKTQKEYQNVEPKAEENLGEQIIEVDGEIQPQQEPTIESVADTSVNTNTPETQENIPEGSADGGPTGQQGTG